ncbi:MAG: response regulator [Oscillospiraceae bacterium]|nr:response regulator [Oscillospiraceae bacterium]
MSGEPLVLAELKVALMGRFEVSIASEADSAADAIGSGAISAVVICVGDDRERAFTVLRRIGGHGAGHAIPIVILAERGNDEDETAAFEMGAVDYSARRVGTVGALAKRLELRIAAGERLAKGRPEEAPSREAAAEAFLAGKAILVAEDVELNREIVGFMLSDVEGLSVAFASDGKEAVEAFAESPERFAFIIMDVHMPVMDGLEATRAIRALRRGNARSIPIIALTAGVQDDEIARCVESGMDGYLEKPFSYDRFLSVVADHLP